MLNGESNHVNPVEQLLQVYRLIMDNPCFDIYQQYEQRLEQLYELAKAKQLTESDRLLLSEVQILHGELIHVIMEEKEDTSTQIDLLEQKKRISDHYGRQSNNYGVDAFFVDFRK
ncbi:hypothetical protein [Paenibacillus sp.]|jgi:hypothetical protein|uniref:hypothetical protein n=1 Tax=Paenibacillus sp. TaxID=58172 RepID=UPI00281A3DFC|nr:hypothetical protein [Paenibacillus sp.]MDR0268708.1 hypothetical protein [Paenibacillus sp.]